MCLWITLCGGLPALYTFAFHTPVQVTPPSKHPLIFTFAQTFRSKSHCVKFAIFSHRFYAHDQPVINTLIEELVRNDVDIAVYHPYYRSSESKIKWPANIEFFGTAGELEKAQPDYFLSLGGDGTILHAATLVRASGIPVAGINLGRLGFLSGIEKQNISGAVQSLINRSYVIEHRSLLHLDASPALFGESNFALNDFTILKRDTSSMITINTWINGEFLNTYWADGLIVATPTGSTGYSLSCGGPVVFPNSGNLVITPVAPHNLNVRPIVVSDSSIITFEVEGRSAHFLCTLDSRFEQIKAGHQLAVRKADFTIKIVRPHERNFLSTLREKLMWGIDKRNR